MLKSRSGKLKFLLPLAVFVVIAAFFTAGLRLDSTLVPSPLIGKSAPSFNLPQLHADGSMFKPADYHGKNWVLNVWASWCAACLDEHKLLMQLAADGVELVGLNYKDQPAAARRWLRDWGNPYTLTAVDDEGRAGIDWGVYGVPETFVIDRSGKIRFKHIGPLTKETIAAELLPLLGALEG